MDHTLYHQISHRRHPKDVLHNEATILQSKLRKGFRNMFLEPPRDLVGLTCETREFRYASEDEQKSEFIDNLLASGRFPAFGSRA